jgi:hypothetical protein
MLRNIVKNSVIKSYLKDDNFRKNKEPKRYVVLWSSKFYRFINEIMRNKSFEEQEKDYPYIMFFIHNFIDYIFKNGISINELNKKHKYLYRGITNEYTLQNEFIENGFMSTSLDKDISKDFAKENGKLIVIQISTLSKDTKCLLIDESIEDYLHEKEILLLPGFLKRTTIYKNNILGYSYKMNNELINKYQNAKIKVAVGGSPINNKIPHIELKDKLIIWYRAIKNRKVEIIGDIFMPKEEDKIHYFFKKYVLSKDEEYQHISKLIPEYQDIKNNNKLKDSYMVFMAVYDYRKKFINTLNYGLYDEIYTMLFDQSRVQEVKDLIISQYSFLSSVPKKVFKE